MDTKSIINMVGGPVKLGSTLGITPQAISQWDKIPILRCPAIARLTGIPVHELRPDFFETPDIK